MIPIEDQISFLVREFRDKERQSPNTLCLDEETYIQLKYEVGIHNNDSFEVYGGMNIEVSDYCSEPEVSFEGENIELEYD